MSPREHYWDPVSRMFIPQGSPPSRSSGGAQRPSEEDITEAGTPTQAELDRTDLVSRVQFLEGKVFSLLNQGRMNQGRNDAALKKSYESSLQDEVVQRLSVRMDELERQVHEAVHLLRRESSLGLHDRCGRLEAIPEAKVKIDDAIEIYLNTPTIVELFCYFAGITAACLMDTVYEVELELSTYGCFWAMKLEEADWILFPNPKTLALKRTTIRRSLDLLFEIKQVGSHPDPFLESPARLWSAEYGRRWTLKERGRILR